MFSELFKLYGIVQVSKPDAREEESGVPEEREADEPNEEPLLPSDDDEPDISASQAVYPSPEVSDDDSQITVCVSGDVEMDAVDSQLDSNI